MKGGTAMSMTREQAIKHIEDIRASALKNLGAKYAHGCEGYYRTRIELSDICLTALRPVSREQVILCKDCRYWQNNNGGYPHPECRWGNDETPDEDDYCSFAERLEVSKNG